MARTELIDPWIQPLREMQPWIRSGYALRCARRVLSVAYRWSDDTDGGVLGERIDGVLKLCDTAMGSNRSDPFELATAGGALKRYLADYDESHPGRVPKAVERAVDALKSASYSIAFVVGEQEKESPLPHDHPVAVGDAYEAAIFAAEVGYYCKGTVGQLLVAGLESDFVMLHRTAADAWDGTSRIPERFFAGQAEVDLEKTIPENQDHRRQREVARVRSPAVWPEGGKPAPDRNRTDAPASHPLGAQGPRVFFFGAGASKACGLPLTRELVSALRSPQKYGITFPEAKHEATARSFAIDSDRAVAFLDLIASATDDPVSQLERAFAALVAAEQASVGHGPYPPESLRMVHQSLIDALCVLLNPAFAPTSDEHPYMGFAEWASRQSDWIAVVTTNWDQLLDDYISLYYSDGSIDMGADESPVDGLVPLLMQSGGLPPGKYCSLYKLNGSATWFFCPNDRRFYGLNFQPPYNLLDVLRTGEDQCPQCGANLERRLYAPGGSRSAFPIARRMVENTLTAVRSCRELVFIGFSCPPEDRDIVEAVGACLSENEDFWSGGRRPVVIQTVGGHADATKARYESYLGCEVDYRDCGFEFWVEGLGRSTTT